MARAFPSLAILALLLLPGLPAAAQKAAVPAPGGVSKALDGRAVEFFEKKIRPVLAERCYQCHSAQAKKHKGGLELDTRAGLLKGGASGPAVIPGQVGESLLLKALRHGGDLKMPPDGKLPGAVVADFEAWVRMGAPDPRDGAAARPAAIDWDKARQFWAFQPPRKHPPPTVRDARWPKKLSDVFILAELEKRGLQPVRPATRRELIRRATFDLTGLPPTPEAVEAFLQDASPDAFARVVDRLLASPHYGERWARHWLDVARYADDQALAFTTPSPHAHRYRDWVSRAFNADMPYDRFLRLQLAGDLLPETPTDYFDRLAGLGFQGLGAKYHKGSVAAQVMADELDDRIDTLTRGLLGLTVACARCHDHKYDPIPARDYYSLAAAYHGAAWTDLPLMAPEGVARFKAWQQATKQKQAQLAQWLKKHGQKAGKPNAPDKDVRGRLSEPDRKHYDALRADLEQHQRAAPPAPVMVHGVSGGGKAMPVYLRGSVERPGAIAPPGFLRILRDDDVPAARKQFTRLDLADAIASARNPLTARVLVNRVWHHHFGRGIVGTPSNFGKLGDRPTHPELLDTLAVRFVESGWSLKWLHCEILLSAAYQLGSDGDPQNAAKDPDNHYLWRMTPRRLDVEAWRDALLAVSGRLDRTVGGPSLALGDAKNVRRTVYAKVSRHVPSTLLTLFDFPDANVSSARRAVTTVPQQQLFVLNSDFMIDSARALAARLARAAPGDPERIALAFRLAYGRPPTAAETALGLEFLRSAAPRPDDRLTPWEQYAQALLATNEFTWVE
jgi:hypothetical protein